MWGNILTEVSYMQNFNMSFSNNKSDILIHLTQWQYWWWFWFSFLWALYYLLVARVFRYRTLKFNPRIASTLRPHGKWGDLLTCIIPVTWCLNILINANFILKLIEWQSESSLFTLRVRAKQWYWIYNLDLRNISDIFSTPRNIGRNKWQFSTFGDLQTAEDYLHIMQMRAYNSFAQDFWVNLKEKAIKKNKFDLSTPVDIYRSEFLKNINLTLYNNILDKKNILNIIDSELCAFETIEYMLDPYNVADEPIWDDYPFFRAVLNSKKDHGVDYIEHYLSPSNRIKDSLIISRHLSRNFKPDLSFFNSNYLYTTLNDILILNLKLSRENSLKLFKCTFFTKDLLFNQNSCIDTLDHSFFAKSTLNLPKEALKKIPKITEFSDSELTNSFDSTHFSSLNNFFQHEILNNYNCVDLIRHPDPDEETRLFRKSWGKNTPFRVLKCPNTDLFFKDSFYKDTNIEILRFRFNEQNATTADKPILPTVFLTFKQRRYKIKNSILENKKIFSNKDCGNTQKYSGNPFLKEASIIEENIGNPIKQYKLVKKAKSRLDTTRVANWNRLLRSRRVLVLPAHINITVITNSYDVVHSWHIPGLGLKMDCLPGRATHHTMYIDNVGLYYGQCAEVCGRYHHHMPIRVCALPFEHFLVWWHTFGLPKFLLYSGNKDKIKNFPTNKYFLRRFSW